MSNIHDGPLATYNPLTDRNLAGYFGNTRMRRHLRKAGLINHRGEIISENQYRVNMARKEHKKHVKELLAQAIVHKTLDLERYRQVEIKRKLEEIAKIELVRRVRASRGRKGDEEVLPYLTPRSMSRPQSERPSESSSVPRRPKSAPAPPRNRPSSSRGFVDPYEDMYIENGPYRRLVIYVDDDGRPVSPPPSDRASSKDLRTEGIDTRHLYALDSEALHQYALKLSRSERGRDGATSPYLISQFPVPPKSDRVKSARSPRRSARMSARPEGPAKERRAGVRQSDQIPHSARKDPDTVEGALMLHRQEPAMMHQGEVQTLCEIQMKYHGPNLTLPRDQHDPTQEVAIEQQHCGGNTLPVFRERLQPGKTFSFISRRHRGYPFSLTLYIDGRVDCRISTCCEYKHGVGVRLGGKMGHFSLTGISGATPCYKCKLSCQAPPRSLKLKKTSIKKKKERAPEPQEEVTVDNTPRSPVVPSKQEPEVNGKSDDDNYEDDFEDEENKYEDDFEPETEDRRQIIGLQVDEDRENGQTVKVDVKEKEEEEAKEGTLPEHRRIEGYSSEDEDLQGGKEPFKVSADVHETQKKERKLSTSSSSSASSRLTTPVPAKVITAKTVVSPVREDPPLKSDRTDTTERSTTSTTSGSLTTATESTLEPHPPSVPKPQRQSKTSSSSSSSNSSSSSDTEDEKYKRKKRDKRLKEEAERMKRELEEKEKERNQRQEEEEQRRKQEEEERKRRFEEEDRRRREELEKREEERRQRDLEIKKRKAEEERKRQEEHERRRAEEERIHAGYQKQLLLIKQQRESDDNIQVLTDNAKQSNERSVIEIESKESLTTQTMAKGPEVPTEQSDTESTTTGTTTTTESESGQEKEKPTIAPIAPMSTITEEKEKQRERHSSSSSSGSSSTSDGEYDLSDQQQKKEPEQVKAAPVVEAKVEVREEPEKLLVPPPQQKVSSTEESSSSSGSSTETESDEDNKKVETPKETVVETRTVVQEETPKQEVPAQQPQEKDPVPDTVPPPKQPPATNSSSGETTSSTETDAESTPRPKMEQQKVPSPIPESVTMLRGINTKDQMPQSVTTETKAEGPKKEETEDSSSDSSSGSSSDSDSETETDDKKPKPGSGGPVSESDGENMHGGNDPENVAEQINKPDSRLAQSSVKPPVLLDGSILPLIKEQTTVEINGVQLDDEQVTELCNYIAEKDYISSLTVRNAGLDDMAFQNVALSLQVSLSSPTLLNFSQNKLSGKAMSHLSPVIKKNSDLSILILNGNPIGNGGCKVIVDGILKAKDPFPFLRRASGYLTLSEARAQEAEGKTVDYKEPEPENNCTIKELDLGDTNMSEAGILEISRLLENNKTLVSLNLNGNTDISVKGWERLGEALKENTSLKTLSLDFTNLGDEGLECLVKGLQVNTGLRALELESAGLTEKGGQLLLELLKSNTSILELTATTGNNISDSTLAEIRKYLKLNNTSSRQ